MPLLQIIPQIDSYFLTVIDQTDQFYQFAALNEYSFWRRAQIRLADLIFYISIRLISSTIRFETQGLENLDAVEVSGTQPIIAFWHDRIFLGTYFFRHRGIVVMTSKSFDGEYIARFIQRFGYGAVRGSSSRGGSRALVSMIRAMKLGLPMSFSVDGPRGPRYVAKAGAVILAKKTGNPIIPFVVEPRHYWSLKSWDKMQIPMPFSRAFAIIGDPIFVEPSANDSELENKLAEVQRSLDSLVEQGIVWKMRK